jgi:tripartite-type tricarboxylate transporter receptor subunit TctC
MNATSICVVLQAAAILTTTVAGPSLAQGNYPSQTIRIVVPVPPGVILDSLPRMIGDKLSAKWGKPVVIENRPGASQNVGLEAVAAANPDGYTLIATPPSVVTNQFAFSKLRYDPNAFVPVTVMATVPTVFVANPKVPVSNMQELIAYAKANPGKLTYASPGAGSPPQLGTEFLLKVAGINILHVPYQGMAPAQSDLLAGHVDVMLNNLGNVLPLVREGKLKLLAVNTPERLSVVPDTPAMSELINGFVLQDWFAILAPPNTPPALANQISNAIAETLKLPDVVKRLDDLYVVPVGSSPADATTFIAQERERWRQIAASIGLQPM